MHFSSCVLSVVKEKRCFKDLTMVLCFNKRLSCISLRIIGIILLNLNCLMLSHYPDYLPVRRVTLRVE